MLCYRDYDAARRQAEHKGVYPHSNLDVIWHPERGQLNGSLPRDYLERQVAPAIAKKQRLAKKLFDAGAQLFLGTDVAQPFVVPGASLQEEMALFAGAGIRLEQVWKLATRDAGERLGVNGLGCLEAGALANIVLFRHDPTQKLDHLASLEAVVANGRLYRIADLKAALRGSRAYFASPLIKAVGAAVGRAGAGARGRTGLVPGIISH
jgi:hypothetical protein